MDSMRLDNEGPDYAGYSLEELEDVLTNIDKARFPERYAKAKALYEKKRTAPSNELESTLTTSIEKPKWSELHALTRTALVAFLVSLGGSIVGLSSDFMASKSWTANTGIPIWLAGLSMVALWFMVLANDHKFSQHLQNSARGKITIVVIPIAFFIFTFSFIDIGIPRGLHLVASKVDANELINYEKTDGTKSCHHRIKLVENRELESAYLCLSSAQRDRLPKKGQVLIYGKRSAFGLSIERFALKRKRRGIG